MSEFINLNDENSWFLIVNPTAGNKNFSKQWNEIKHHLAFYNITFSFAFTAFSKHEIELVQTAIQKGYRKFISVGGDGTLHHVVNGIMLQRYVKTSDITIGVIPLGTGNDWIKTYNIPNSIEKSVAIIAKNKKILQDIGVLNTETNKLTFFNNVAGLGFDGYVVQKLKKLKKFGSIGYLLAGLSGFLFYKKSILKIILNDETIESKTLMAVVGICKYAGGGMQFTKDVDSTDGYFDVTIAKNLTFFDLILNLPKLYNGKIVHHKKVASYKTKHIVIIPNNAKPIIQADGELVGTGKLEIKSIEKAIHFVIN